MSAPSTMQFVDVTAADGSIVSGDWLGRAEALHRVLRPQLPNDYVATMTRIAAGGGRLVLAVDADRVVGLAVWRVLENTVFGRFLYVDDLVTREAERSTGVGRALLARCEATARAAGCAMVVLDSGVQRDRAHRFYFREGYAIKAFNFGKRL